MPMTVVAFCNRKGGTGKTTTAVNLGACLAERGHDVLLIDLDPQANATTSFGVAKANDDEGVMALLAGKGKLDEIAKQGSQKGVQVVAAGPGLANMEIDLPRTDNWVGMLAKSLRGHGHELVFLDTPPAMGALGLNALAAADGVVVPLQCDYLSLEGLQEFATNLNRMRAQVNPSLRLFGLVKTMYDDRTLLARQVNEELDRYFGAKVFSTPIPRNVRLAEAPSHGLPAISYAPSSSGALAYQALADEFMHSLQ